jgi:hypothetical protein
MAPAPGVRLSESEEVGAQETVGATVWPDLAVQAGYSSVLYLVS